MIAWSFLRLPSTKRVELITAYAKSLADKGHLKGSLDSPLKTLTELRL